MMLDITRCHNKECVMKENCKRFLSKGEKNALFIPKYNTKEKFRCETFLKLK